ncbi:MAG: hypothetical protein R2695_04210 [Acidimicrobiales bacterium]
MTPVSNMRRRHTRRHRPGFVRIGTTRGRKQVLLAWDVFLFVGVVPLFRTLLVRPTGGVESVNRAISAISTFEVPHDGMVFGAGCDRPPPRRG